MKPGITLNMATPISHTSMHARVKLKWWGQITSANPGCDWIVGAGLQAGDSVLLECGFTYSSWYPHDRTTIVYADVDDAVNESEEGNNMASISPFGVDSLKIKDIVSRI